MHQRVTAVLVARSGATHLERTLGALAAQTRRPDAVVVIGVASDAETTQTVTRFGPTQFLATAERLSFPAAVAAAERAIPEPTEAGEWLWLLAQDTAPEPAALERMLAVVEVSPSVAIAGPKLVDWDDSGWIREFGVSMTPMGATVPLVEDELDQAQHDGVSDVLGVSAAGMLVRHTVWQALGGLDFGLPVVDGGLDFSVRARLAGHRVVLAPLAHLAIADDGVAVAKRLGVLGTTRKLYRERRAAQLHRRLAYAGGGALLWHWLSLVPLAIARSIGWLLSKQPGAIGGELAAAFATAFGAGHLAQARRNVSRTRAVGWNAIAPLRIPFAEVRRRRAMQRETAVLHARGERAEIGFFSGGGAWVVFAALVVSVGVLAPLLGASAINGGGLLPLADTVRGLWSGIGWGWRDSGLGFAGPSDPFAAVIAVLGSITFWQPSFALVLLWFAAAPLAALGSWLLGARLTERTGLRAVLALVYALSPVLFSELHAGRPAAVLAYVLLPWLVFAAFSARHSWAASGATSLLAAAVVACAPSLIPALAVAWAIWTVLSGRNLARTIGVPIPAIALFAPLVLTQLAQGSWLRIFADPGAPQPSAHPTAWQLLLGLPEGTARGWGHLGSQLGLPAHLVAIGLVVLTAPLIVLALLALFFRTQLRAGIALLGALLGFATAFVAVGIAVQSSGASSVALSAGPGLSLYWLGLAAAASLGLASVRSIAVAGSWIAVAASLVAVAPLAAALPLGTSDVAAGDAASLPAYVTADAAQHPRIATLVVVPQRDGSLTAELVHGDGATLEDQSTLASTGTETGASAADATALATLAGNLVSPSGLDASPTLAKYGISYVFVDGVAKPDEAQTALTARAAVALDANPLFAQLGSTSTGTLWGASAAVKPLPVPASDDWRRPAILTALIVVFGFALLLSIPTGQLTEAERRADRRARRTAAQLAARRGGTAAEGARPASGELAGTAAAETAPQDGSSSVREPESEEDARHDFDEDRGSDLDPIDDEDELSVGRLPVHSGAPADDTVARDPRAAQSSEGGER